ncbi:hypothetical protein ACFX13_008595 [Malus domestica]
MSCCCPFVSLPWLLLFRSRISLSLCDIHFHYGNVHQLSDSPKFTSASISHTHCITHITTLCRRYLSGASQRLQSHSGPFNPNLPTSAYQPNRQLFTGFPPSQQNPTRSGPPPRAILRPALARQLGLTRLLVRPHNPSLQR